MMDEVLDLLKTWILALLVILLDYFSKNPVGGIASILGLLVLYERLRTQRLINQEHKINLKRKLREEKEETKDVG